MIIPRPPYPGAYVESLSWSECEAEIARGCAAVLPVGALAKSHGPHLPNATDAIQCRFVTDRLIRRYRVLIWPLVSYGHYPAFVEYPGSTTLSEPVFEACVADILGSIEASGHTRIVILNSGLSTIPALNRAVNDRDGSVLLNLYAGDQFRQAVQSTFGETLGSHADEVETSVMLAIAPGQVNMRSAVLGTTEPLVAGPLNRSAPAEPNFTASGATGDPRRAARTAGRTLVEAMMADVCETMDNHLPPRDNR
jgi:creatinine amidohydrolase